MIASNNPPSHKVSRTLSPDETDVYFASHYLNKPSQLYGCILWAIILAALLISQIPLPIEWRQTFSNATSWRIIRHRTIWSQRSLRRLFRSPFRPDSPNRTASSAPSSSSTFLPSNGNLLLLYLCFILLCSLYTVGPDYIRGSSYSKEIVDTSGRESISKSLWTSAARAGLIAFSLLPLCVLLALKSSPAAIFSWNWTLQLFFDKLALFHRWTARVLYLFTVLHVVLWTVKLCNDRISDGRRVIEHAFKKDRFVSGWLVRALLSHESRFPIKSMLSRLLVFSPSSCSRRYQR